MGFRNLYRASVFDRMPSSTPTEVRLVVFFHRLSATNYFITAAWGVVGALFGITTFVLIWDRPIQVVYSGVVALAAVLACVGATFYGSRRAKLLELFAGSSVLVLTLFYSLAVAYRACILGDDVVKAVAVFSLGSLVVPASRTAFIFLWGER